MKRLRLEIRGCVQGVGFRPFLYRSAKLAGVAGFAENSPHGVFCEIEGEQSQLDFFLVRLTHALPPSARIEEIRETSIPVLGSEDFFIHSSYTAPTLSSTHFPTDRATCGACLQEFWDKSSRRYLYPFISCDSCGPRFSISRGLPFERANTAMSSFPLCASCQSEYGNPLDRRFFAQTISCAVCGPSLSVKSLSDIAYVVQSGGLLAIKSTGGYQFVCAAKSQNAVARIRNFKKRATKPLAVMAPSVEFLEKFVDLNGKMKELLCSPASPIVILPVQNIAQNLDQHLLRNLVAPGLNKWGVMLPSWPLYHFLAFCLNDWLVVTSANLAGEPMIRNDEQAKKLLEPHVDLLVFHNREIFHTVDDSVFVVANNYAVPVRTGRGHCPTVFNLPRLLDGCYVGLGAHERTTFAVSSNQRVSLSQHFGHIDNPAGAANFMSEIKFSLGAMVGESVGYCQTASGSGSGLGLYSNVTFVHDAHPDSASAQFFVANLLPSDSASMPHHVAHIASLVVEKSFCLPASHALAVAFDGLGLGPQGELFGGEFFWLNLANEKTHISHLGSLRDYKLPGGDKAAKETKMPLLGVLYEVLGDAVFRSPLVTKIFLPQQRETLQALFHSFGAVPRTTSVGRLFDAVAALLELSSHNSFEAESAIKLQDLAEIADGHKKVGFGQWTNTFFKEKVIWQWDWRPMILQILTELAKANQQSIFACKASLALAFHHAICDAVIALANLQRAKVILASGGVFQNTLILNLLEEKCKAEAIALMTHEKVPSGDGGISLGQAAQGLFSWE